MATEILRPNAAGDETNLEVVGATVNYQAVDEAEADDDVTYVRSPSAGSGWYLDLYNLADHSLGSGTINKITVYARCKWATEAGHQIKIAIKSGATVAEGDVETLTSAYVDYSHEWTTDPDTDEAWTWDAIDALQAGINSNDVGTGHPRCTQVYVEVDYTAGATEKTSSDSGSGAEGTPLSSAILAGSETGSGIEALFARLLAAIDTGTGTEAGGLQYDKALSATETAEGSDRLTAKIEIPTKGGGMKLWT